MSIDANLLTLFRSLVANYDSTITTTEGSDFYQKIIFPLLTRVGGDILDADLETFFAQLLSERHPTLDTSEFSGIRDLIIRPVSTMMEPVRREIKAIGLSQSLTNADLLTTSEVNGLLSNFFLEKTVGGFSTGTVRVFFNSPIDVNTSGAVFRTAAGLEFVPSSNELITSAQMSFNVSGSLFYIDVVCTSTTVGDEYNIEINQITTVDGISAAVSASNITNFIGGSPAETNAQAVARARDSVTTQNLVTKNGISTVLRLNYSGISDLHTIGFGEAEMLRDLVDGPATVSKVPGGVFTQSSIDIPAGGIHIGGKTDVYLYDGTSTGQVSNSLSLSNITDAGIPIMGSQTGFVTAAGSPQKIYDRTGYFDRRDIIVGDKVYIGSNNYPVAAVNADYIEITGSISAPQSGVSYEVRRLSSDSRIRIPLHNLSALTTEGLTAVSYSSATTPAQPIPGNPDLSPLTNGLSQNVAKTENIVQIVDSSSAGNIVRPVFDITTVQLGSGGGAYTDLGKIPLAEVLEVTAPSGFLGADGASNKARGVLRVYVKEKANIMAVPTDKYTTDSSASDYTTLSVEQNPVIVDTKTSQRITGPIYKNGDFKYGIEGIGPAASSSTNPWSWGVTHTGLTEGDNLATSTDTGSTGVADGNYIYFQRDSANPNNNPAGFTPNIWPPTRGMWLEVGDASKSKQYKLLQITEVTSVTGTKSGANPSTDYYRCKVRAEDDADCEFNASGSEIFRLFQGFLGEDLQFDENYRVYYADFKAYCINSTATNSNISSSSEITLTKHINIYDPTQNLVPFNDSLSGDSYDFYVEGYTLKSNLRGLAFTTREQPYIQMTNFVTLVSSTNVSSSSTRDLSDSAGVNYSLKVSYQQGTTASLVQNFVEQDANRIVAEDIIIKPFLPAIIYGAVTGIGITSTSGEVVIKDYMLNLPSTSTFEISDLISHLYEKGVTHVKMPLKFYVMKYSQERKVTGERVFDSSTLSKIERFRVVTGLDGFQSVRFIVGQ